MDIKLPYNKESVLRVKKPAGYIVLFLSILFSASACMFEDDGNAINGSDGDKEIILRMAVPGGSRSNTRAIDEPQENTISTVDVLVFKIDGNNETFDYSATGYPTADNVSGSSTQMFTVTLRIKPYPQRMVIIANARTAVGTLLANATWTGEDKQTMLSKLEFALPSGSDHWNATSATNFTPMPMWGESSSETITPTTTQLSQSINVMRMVARIDVQLDTIVAGLTDKFKVKSVNLYNSNTGGLIVPSASAVTEEVRNNAPYLYVTTPSIPTAFQPYNARHLGPVVYEDFTAPGVTDVAITGAIYTFEVAAATDETETTCLVVGGVYNGDTNPTYYRLDFIGSDGTTKLDILRNYRYAVNITDVLGSGHPTADEAFVSKAVNITAEILRWNESGMGNIVFDGTNTLSVSQDTISLYRDATTTTSTDNKLEVYTDYPSGWTIEKIVDATTGAVVSWLSLAPASGSVNQKVNAVITCSQNTTGTTRSVVIWITAGRLRYPVTVNQSIIPQISLDIVDASGNPITELAFDSIGSPKPQSFTVKWTPASDGVVKIVSTPVAATSFPTTDTGAPISGTLTGISGTQTYSISPPAFTTAESNADPFLVKASTVNFTISNGVTSITKSITLKQIRYNIVLSTPQRYYLVDGSTNTLTVKSNAGWHVKSVAQNSYTGAALLVTGGNNNLVAGSNGDLLRFTTTSTSNWGTVNVILESTDNPKRFNDISTQLVFAAKPLIVYGISSVATGVFNTDRAGYYNVIPVSSSTGVDINAMLTATANYGVPPTSSKVIISSLTVTGSNLENSSTPPAITTDVITTALNANADVIVLAGSVSIDATAAAKLNSDVLQTGKTLIVFSDGTYASSVQNLMNAVFGTRTPAIVTASINSTTAAMYQLANTNDLVLNGPFGDVRNGYWGNDGGGPTIGLVNLPSAEVVQFSTGTNMSGTTSGIPSGYTATQVVTGFRHKTLNLIYFGDGGFLHSANQSNETDSPSIINSTTKLPTTKTYGGSSASKQQSANAILMANMIAFSASSR